MEEFQFSQQKLNVKLIGKELEIGLVETTNNYPNIL